VTRIRSTLRGLHALAGPFAPFVIEDALDSPVAQFDDWLAGAVEGGLAEPHAMTLSTLDVDGTPDARVLLAP
jgi:pyridoxamine 5'-phosphate oxidase